MQSFYLRLDIRKYATSFQQPLAVFLDIDTNDIGTCALGTDNAGDYGAFYLKQNIKESQFIKYIYSDKEGERNELKGILIFNNQGNENLMPIHKILMTDFIETK